MGLPGPIAYSHGMRCSVGNRDVPGRKYTAFCACRFKNKTVTYVNRSKALEFVDVTLGIFGSGEGFFESMEAEPFVDSLIKDASQVD